MELQPRASFRARILAALADGKILKSVDLCREAGCHRAQISRLGSELEQLEGGYYCLPETYISLLDRLGDVAIALRYPGGVICLMAAARRWNLVSETRDSGRKDTVLMPIDASHNEGPATVIRTLNPRFFITGVVVEELAPGLSCRVTNPERTVCDLFAAKGTRGVTEETAYEVLERYVSLKGPHEAMVRLSEMSAALGRDGRELNAVLETMRRMTHHAPR